MTNYWKWLGVWLLFAMPATGLAAGELSYNYVEASYVNVDIDDFDEDADGFGVAASGQLGESVFVFAGYTDVETDSFDVDTGLGTARVKAEVQEIVAGLGYRMPLQSGTDLNATVAFVDAEIEASSGGFSDSEDDTGFGLGLGLRHLFTPQFEGGAGINYVDIHDDSSTAFSLSALLHATEVLSFGTSYTFGDDADVWTVGGRLNF